MEFNRIDYKDLNAKQKENYNFHKISSKLADYGYNSIRLTDDWNGADFIAIHINGNVLKFQQKGRLTISKNKYSGDDIWIVYIEDDLIKLYNHNKIKSILEKEIEQTGSWIKENGYYDWPNTPKAYSHLITELK